MVIKKILAGQETVYEITVLKGKQERKKLIDSIIGDDNYADSIRYYYRQLDQNNIEQKRDGTFTYDDFVNSSIDELKDMSEKSGGSKGSRYYRDKDSNLRTKDGTLVTRGNAGAYQ